jgi:hypothetical protein
MIDDSLECGSLTFERACAATILAKFLSAYILVASLGSKLPQIRLILKNRATTGLATTYIYLNVFLYLNSAL